MPAVSLVSVNAAGTGSGNSDSGLAQGRTVSDDGRYVVFVSHASNLVAGDTNNAYDVFVRDTVVGTTTLISSNISGDVGNSDSGVDHQYYWYGSAVLNATISGDGKYVAFISRASDLVANDTNNDIDVFVRDWQSVTPSTVLISANLAGTGSGNRGSFSPVISADGKYVAFVSGASDLVNNDTSYYSTDVFVRDWQSATPTTHLISANADGTGSGNGFSYEPSISADGKYVAFTSVASNLTANDDNFWKDVFVRDWQSATPTTTLISVNSTGTNTGQSSSFKAVISTDGNFVAFLSYADDLTDDDNNFELDLFVRDWRAAVPTTTLVSGTAAGSSDGYSFDEDEVIAISADGRFVAFSSRARNLGSNESSNDYDLDVFLRATREPPTAAIGGPYVVVEGSNIVLDATGTYDPNQLDDTLIYLWDLDGDGVFGETGPGASRGNEVGVTPTFIAVGVDDGVVPLALRVIDLHGMTDEVTSTITVLNAAPQFLGVNLTPSVIEGGTVTLSGSFTDPGGLDTFTLTVTWGDGTSNTFTYPAGTTSFSVTHLYPDDSPTGTPVDPMLVGLTLRDDDGGTATEVLSIVVDEDFSGGVGLLHPIDKPHPGDHVRQQLRPV